MRSPLFAVAARSLVAGSLVAGGLIAGCSADHRGDPNSPIRVGVRFESAETRWSQLAAGLMPLGVPENLTFPGLVLRTSTGELLLPENAGPNFEFDVDRGEVVTVEIEESATLLPARGSKTGIDVPQGHSAPALFKQGELSLSAAVTAAGGPDQATQIARGACVVEIVRPEDPALPYEGAVLDLGSPAHDVYAIRYDAQGKATAALSSDGGTTGYFLILSRDAATPGPVPFALTPKAGTYRYGERACDLQPGYFQFEFATAYTD